MLEYAVLSTTICIPFYVATHVARVASTSNITIILLHVTYYVASTSSTAKTLLYVTYYVASTSNTDIILLNVMDYVASTSCIIL